LKARSSREDKALSPGIAGEQWKATPQNGKHTCEAARV
jgi:hypothetical protein